MTQKRLATPVMLTGLSLFALSRLALAQEPVPSGEARKGVLVGRVTTVDREGVAAATVEAQLQPRIYRTRANQTGGFRLALPPGSYTIRVAANGAVRQLPGIVVTSGGEAEVPVVLPAGGTVPAPVLTEVPVAEPSTRPSDSLAALVVLEHEVASGPALQRWLDETDGSGKQLQNVIPERRGISLFVFRSNPNPRRPALVRLVKESLGATSLSRQLLNSRSGILGVHLLTPSSYALVLSSGE